jgi:hypothetical protein
MKSLHISLGWSGLYNHDQSAYIFYLDLSTPYNYERVLIDWSQVEIVPMFMKKIPTYIEFGLN